jgi:hypothetical protein
MPVTAVPAISVTAVALASGEAAGVAHMSGTPGVAGVSCAVVNWLPATPIASATIQTTVNSSLRMAHTSLNSPLVPTAGERHRR